MNILVTGANGLVGRGICERLNADPQNTVLALTHAFTDETAFRCDLAREDLEIVLRHQGIDAVIHCAAAIPQNNVTDEWVYQQNTAMDANVVNYCRRHEGRLIFISTVGVYSHSNGCVNAETSPVQPNNQYFRGKLETEALIQAQCPSYTILRIPSPYGPRQTHTTVLKLFIEKALRSEQIGYYGMGNRTQNFVHVRDIASAVEKTLRSDRNELFNIASARSVSMKELAELVVGVAQRDFHSISVVQPVPKPDAQESCRSNISIQKARELLDWQPEIRLEDGVLDWMRQLEAGASLR